MKTFSIFLLNLKKNAKFLLFSYFALFLWSRQYGSHEGREEYSVGTKRQEEPDFGSND